MKIAYKQIQVGKTISARKNLKEQLRRRRSFERKLIPQLQSWFEFSGEEAIRDVNSNRPIQLNKSRNRLSQILAPHYASVIKVFGDNFHYIRRKNEDRFDLYYKEYMAQFGGQKITQMTNTQQKKIINAIVGYEGVTAIGDRIREINSPLVTKARSVLIARTETHSASTYANHKIAKDAQLPLRKRWVATNDGRTRSHHSSLSGQEVGIDEDFIVNVNGVEYRMNYAGDPRGGAVNTINCRCVVMYVEPDDIVVDTTEPEIKPDDARTPNVIDIAVLLNRASKDKRKRYNDDFNSQIDEQQKEIVDKLPKPSVIKNTKKGVYYSQSKILQAELEARDGQVFSKTVKSYVIAHEYGHHVDYELSTKRRKWEKAWSEGNQDFIDAINDDVSLHGFRPHGRYNINVRQNSPEQLKAREKFMDIWEEKLAYKENGKIILRGDGYGEVSDIVDAIVGGLFYKNRSMWGHGVSYFRDAGYREKEIFANLFSLKNDPKAYALAKELLPNTVKRFEDKLNQTQINLSNVPSGGIE